MPWNVCRICLAGNKKMYLIANAKLLDVFEKVTGNEWAKDKRPRTLCYICFYQLMKCLKLREIFQKSEAIFSQFFAGGFEFTDETIPILNERKQHKFLVTPVQAFSVGVYGDSIVEVTIKQEDDNEIGLKDSSIDVKNEANHTTEIKDTNTSSDKILEKITPKCAPNHNANQKDIEHRAENMDATDSYEEEKVNSRNGNNIHIQNEVKMTSKHDKPQSQNQKHEVNQIKADSKDQIEPKRICFTLKFNISKNKNATSQNSKENLNVTDDDKMSIYTCKYCEKSYRVKYALEKHLRTHEKDLYSCEYCSKTFSLKSVLKLHEETHTKLKNPVKLQRLSSDRDRSQTKGKLHLREYGCELCEKSFNQLSNLQQHMRTHTGERPYKCETCSKEFKQLSNLRQHSRVHSGDRPFQCNSCHKAFVQLSNLEQHKHHPENV